MKNKLRKTGVFLLISLILFGLNACGPKNPPGSTGDPGDAEYVLTVLATNDLHGHFDTLPKYLTIINQIRSERENVLLLDAGDIFRRGPYEGYRGEIETALFNYMGYNAMALGNNEFSLPGGKTGPLAAGDAQIADIIGWADFPVLCGNITYKTGGYIEGTLPYITEELGGLKIAIIGITSEKPFSRKYETVSDKEFIPGEKAVARLLPEAREESDIQIVLSHAGLAADNKIKDVAAVIGGDDHKKLENYANKQGVPVTQAGGETKHWLSRLDLFFKQENGEWRLISFENTLYSAEGIEKDPGLQNLIDSFLEEQIAA